MLHIGSLHEKLFMLDKYVFYTGQMQCEQIDGYITFLSMLIFIWSPISFIVSQLTMQQLSGTTERVTLVTT